LRPASARRRSDAVDAARTHQAAHSRAYRRGARSARAHIGDVMDWITLVVLVFLLLDALIVWLLAA
jgi:hypothetical protein